MKKRMRLAVLCLLVAASGCAQPLETATAGTTQETAWDITTPVAEEKLYGFSAETPKGVYYLDEGRGQCFLDYAAAENRPLCAVPGCTHTGADCAACLPEGTYDIGLYPLADGSLVYILQDDASYSFWRMDSNGDNRQELGRMETENEIWGFLCADGQYLYLYSVTYGEGEQFTVSRLPLTGGMPEALWSKTEYSAPQLLGVTGRDLVFLWYDWSKLEEVPPAAVTHEMSWEEIRVQLAMHEAEMDLVTGNFRVMVCSIDTGEEQVLDTWTSTYDGTGGRTLYWAQNRLFWLDSGKPGPLHWITADGQTGELAVDWTRETTQWQGDLYINLECRVLQDKILLTVCETQGTDPVVSRYALDLATGTLQEIPLQYIANATQEPISIEGQGEDCLFVIFEEQVQMGTQLDPDGMPTTSMETHRRYGLISTEDFLAGIPKYREIQLAPQ